MYAVVNWHRLAVNFDCLEFIKDLVKGFIKGIWTYLGTLWKGSSRNEAQEMAADNFQALEAKPAYKKEELKRPRVSEVKEGGIGCRNFSEVL